MPQGTVHVTEGNGGVPGVVGTSTMTDCGDATAWCRKHGTGAYAHVACWFADALRPRSPEDTQLQRCERGAMLRSCVVSIVQLGNRTGRVCVCVCYCLRLLRVSVVIRDGNQAERMAAGSPAMRPTSLTSTSRITVAMSPTRSQSCSSTEDRTQALGGIVIVTHIGSVGRRGAVGHWPRPPAHAPRCMGSTQTPDVRQALGPWRVVVVGLAGSKGSGQQAWHY